VGLVSKAVQDVFKVEVFNPSKDCFHLTSGNAEHCSIISKLSVEAA
jgi:hypothetical protein